MDVLLEVLADWWQPSTVLIVGVFGFWLVLAFFMRKRDPRSVWKAGRYLACVVFVVSAGLFVLRLLGTLS